MEAAEGVEEEEVEEGVEYDRFCKPWENIMMFTILYICSAVSHDLRLAILTVFSSVIQLRHLISAVPDKGYFCSIPTDDSNSMYLKPAHGLNCYNETN